MFSPDPASARIGPFWITPGWTRANAATVWAASFLTIGLSAFMSFAQPYILNEVLRVPQGDQGTLTGTLAALQEIIVITLVSFVGIWSDRVSRRRVYYLGFLAMSLGYAVYPFATNIGELILYRCVFAIGIAMAPLMLSACMVDAIQEVTRGRWIGSNNVLQGLGVVVMALLLAKSPAWYASLGADPVSAGRFAYWTAAAVCVVAAVTMAVGLPRIIPGRPGADAEPMLRQIVTAIGQARRNPRLAVAYGGAFIGRGDFTVVGVYFSLWIVQAGMDLGMSSADALGKAGMLFGIVQGAAMLWAFFMGMIVDRLNRLTGLCLALTLAGTGYLLMGQVEDPFGPNFIPIALLLGMGEVSVIVAGGALLGQEAPATNRGPIVGFYNAVGGIGILFATYVGGLAFDNIGRTAPFTVMGLLNAVLLVCALVVRTRSRLSVEPSITPARQNSP